MGFWDSLFSSASADLAGKTFTSNEFAIALTVRLEEEGRFGVATSLDIAMGHGFSSGTWSQRGTALTFTKDGKTFEGRVINPRQITYGDLTMTSV